MKPKLAAWAAELALLYESHATNQFILYGNIEDDFPSGDGSVGLTKFLSSSLLASFEVLLTYDLGNGLRIARGDTLFSQWRLAAEAMENRRAPRSAVEVITHYLRYVANLSSLGQKAPSVGVIIQSASLLAPALPQALNYDLNALALLMRDWSRESLLRRHSIATFLITENLTELHPLLAENPDAVTVQIPLPSAEELNAGIEDLATPELLAGFGEKGELLGAELSGAPLKAVRRLLQLQKKKGQPLARKDVAAIKKELIEAECGNLVEFIEPSRTLDDFEGQPALKRWLRDDIALWQKNDLRATPMGYLLCGPVGTGKTYAVECLAGEAGVPVVKLSNFRDRWVGSTEGNLEKIFRLLRALGKCFVFVDEADQTLGRRDSGSNDAGLSGRVYSMFAQEMSNRRNRGRIIWILASSRPDLIEVDLKRPGRVDVKIPILPTSTTRESFSLLQALAKRLDLTLAEELFPGLEAKLPVWLTPGAAEVLALKLYRSIHAGGSSIEQALAQALEGYQPPVSREIMEFQIRIALAEATDAAFIPEAFRSLAST